MSDLNLHAMNALFQRFVEWMDSLYYEGFVAYLISFDNERLEFEWNAFLSEMS